MKYLHLIKLRNKTTGKTAITPLKVNDKPYVYEGALSDALKCIVDSIKHFESTMLPMFDSEIVEFIVCDDSYKTESGLQYVDGKCANCGEENVLLEIEHPVPVGETLFTHVCSSCQAFHDMRPIATEDGE